MPAGLYAYPMLGTVTDADGIPHPGYHDGTRWYPLGEIQLGYTEVTSPVVVATGKTVTVLAVDVTFAGIGQVCSLLVDLPMVDFTDTSGGEVELSVTLDSVAHGLAHLHGDRSLGWPARTARRLPIPGPGTYTFTVAAQSISGNVTLQADADANYGPISAAVTVVG